MNGAVEKHFAWEAPAGERIGDKDTKWKARDRRNESDLQGEPNRNPIRGRKIRQAKDSFNTGFNNWANGKSCCECHARP
jgi:hypothetical protein